MQKQAFIKVVIVMLAFASYIQAGVSVIMNGSFEDNAPIGDITLEPLADWNDVNMPIDKFGGEVSNVWSTHGYDDDFHSLTLYSEYNVKCNEGDMAVVSQRVYLDTEVENIIFDLKLSSSSGAPLSTWHPSKRSAIVLIDGNEVWRSNDWEPDANDEYRNQEIDINEMGDGDLHTLSLALRSNVTETVEPYVEYRTRWDFIKFDVHCGGFGYLPQDLNRDCYVDMNDLRLFVAQWLQVSPAEKYDLFEDDDNIVDFLDFSVFADAWMGNTYWANWQEDNCYEIGVLAMDLNYDGIVNFVDFAIFAADWDSSDYEDVGRMTDEWLLETW